ncbi:MAG: RNA-directed DNA polymerase [Clostridia bacterium]|nr:RNA-directed DNA polymerase [Clostridia bacterium]
MPKTLRNEYDKKLTYDNLMKAHFLSSKGKRLRKEIILFNLKQEEYIMYLYQKLKDGTYRHGGYSEFYVTEPKLRRIEKSRYIDRIVHRWVVDNFLKEYFEKSFINQTYACIKNRGMHQASLDVQKAMKHCKRIWNNYYILKMDIRKYFDNIDKDILYSILNKKIKDKKLLWLLQEIIYSDCSKRKSDNLKKANKGLPIGNYTSQLFANIYLNELDQYVKHKLKIKYYFRYLDDVLLFTRTKKEAIQALKNISAFLQKKLKLELNEKTQIFKGEQGINFCGYKINEYRLKIRDRGKRKLKKKIKELKYNIRNGKIDSKEAKRYLAGHMGYIHYANIYHLSKKLFYIEERK